MDLQSFVSILISGVALGVLYALMAFGLAIVWTTLGIFNFAHGAFIAVGAYLAWQFGSAAGLGLGYLPGAGLAVAAMFLLGVATQFVLVRPFERQKDIVLLTVITTLAGATILTNLLNVVWGPRMKQIEPAAGGELSFGLVHLRSQEAIMVVVVGATLAALAWFLLRTATGRSMRAVAQNREAAQLMGLDVHRLYALTFGLAAAVAGLAGIFIASIRFMSPNMGDDPLQKAIVVVILGGVARFTYSIYAAFVVGMIEAFSTYYVGLYWTPAVLFGLMILVLIVKPEGLFGRRQRSV
ncbi:amino acid/amide ABC transporter membrane protein 1 (HAAT family) [Roseiarcus fermentans]|uniref:Amino acid/amide ABC transporter membrane protein 1 (HAAT family) n=1 Tax=Roseiarcus fermentans TaxID=1473586 RepID=A0A366FP25_9HYPH|nr:branched-chain amino acid ABC transporter permease [Roseiarcus fermentans]RBP15886.1 amino acid/amide ABC transporter membrane protein 1 (HAAT family) [Roseiarcus fermentans]